MEEIKLLLFQSSRTQRLTLTKNLDGSCLLSKEWRKTPNEEWIQGKGIMIPTQYVFPIGKLLASNVMESVIAEFGFDYLEHNEGVEKGDFKKEDKNYNKGAYNWRNKSINYYRQGSLGRSS